jgi:ribosomal protein S18 acetylase RimI-like enzyme
VITVRLAAANDRAFLSGIANRLADFDVPLWRSAAEIAGADRAALLQQLDVPRPGAELFVAELGGRPAGCLLMWTLDDYFSGGPHAHISVIAVTREAEGHGVGGALMAHAEQWARNRGHSRITLSVFEANRRAQALYERAGFAVEMRRYVKPLSR